MKAFARSRPLAYTLLAVWIGCVTLVSAGRDTEFVFEPVPSTPGAALLSGATWIGPGPGFTLRLQQIDETQRLAFIESVTGLATDPFATPPGGEPRFLTFLMQLENNGANGIIFRAEQCWLVTNKNEHLLPIGMDTLRTSYGVMGREPGAAYQAIGAAFVPTTHTLGAGETMAGLLVYRKFKPATRSYKVDIRVTVPSGDVVPVTAVYRRVKRSKDRE